jgi:arylsulfatase A-like enzyme
MNLSRRDFLRVGAAGVAGAALVDWTRPASAADTTASARKPNFVILFTDDQGYGDLSCFGSKTIHTPRIDRMAEEGLKLTSFYAQPVCGPSRAALMTGCYAERVIRKWTLAPGEITVAEVLKSAGYATACIGKWDLSGRKFEEGRMPTDQGFDYYFGTLDATDAGRVWFYRDKKPAGDTSDMGSLTGRSTDEAIAFIKKSKDRPFFLYVPYNMPHVKIGASAPFLGKSKGGLYGDVIEEIDWNVGRIVDALKEAGVADNTIVLFTSDNGPWLCWGESAGSAGPLRGGKFHASEGGFRMPAVVWGPGWVKGGRVSDGIVATIDVLPTFAHMAGAKTPTDRVIDGVNQTALFTGPTTESARDTFLFYANNTLQAVRQGQWKMFTGKARALYDLKTDVGEQHNVAAEHPDVMKRLEALAQRAAEDIGNATQPGKNARIESEMLP